MSRANILVILSLFIVGGFNAVATWRAHDVRESNWFRIDQSSSLGAEYDAIANSLRRGKGFSDPFQSEAGPTAWMPPVIPFLLATVYYCAGDQRDVVVYFVKLAHLVVATFTCWLVLNEAWKLQRLGLGLAVVVGGSFANFFNLFQSTHDGWLLLALVNVLWVAGRRLEELVRSDPTAVMWGLLGAVIVLSSPILGAVWILVTLYCTASAHTALVNPSRYDRTSLSLRHFAIAIAVGAAAAAPWCVRNRVMLGSWIPIKSNGAYELWQAHCIDDDGVLDTNTFAVHPWSLAGEQRARHREVGELRFVRECWETVLNAIRQNPLHFLDRVGNRWAAAFLWYQSLGPTDDRLVWPLRWKRLVFWMPFACTIILLLTKQRRTPQESVAVLIFFGTLIPYVVISYYERYSVPLLGIKGLLVVFGGNWAIENCTACVLRIRNAAIGSSIAATKSGGGLKTAARMFQHVIASKQRRD